MVEAAAGNARIFRRSGPYPLTALVGIAGEIANERDPLLEGVANEVSFLDSRRESE